MNTIGAFEAKTHLARLLQRVVQGETVTITRHGCPVARLVPVEASQTKAREAAERIRDRRKRLGRGSIEERIVTTHEGHRY